jgi:hypothetical protein
VSKAKVMTTDENRVIQRTSARRLLLFLNVRRGPKPLSLNVGRRNEGHAQQTNQPEISDGPHR